MIYGLNFGAPDIPADLLKGRALKRHIIRPVVHDNKIVRQKMTLVGLCDTELEKSIMDSQADNGHRKRYWISFERPRKLAGKFAIYVY